MEDFCFSFFPPLFFLPSLFQLDFKSWHRFNLYQIPIYSYHSFIFFLLFFSPLFLSSSNFFLLVSPTFLPSFSFSYSFPFLFLLLVSFFLLLCFSFLRLFFYSPDYFLLSPSSLFLLFLFVFSRHKFLSCFTSLPRGLL